jgi:RNA polymerase sigma-70 factor, ECF subfamily
MVGGSGVPVDLGPWIEAARSGDREGLGSALETFRSYLLLVADRELAPDLRAKGGASDLVQETFLEARRAFHQFDGRTDDELRRWLRTILRRRLAHLARRYRGTEKRGIGREVPLGRGVDLASDSTSPSGVAVREERERRVHDAIERLSSRHREVILGHHREGLGFDEIGRRLGCSAEAARKVWTRAIERLRRELSDPPEGEEASA